MKNIYKVDEGPFSVKIMLGIAPFPGCRLNWPYRSLQRFKYFKSAHCIGGALSLAGKVIEINEWEGNVYLAIKQGNFVSKYCDEMRVLCAI